MDHELHDQLATAAGLTAFLRAMAYSRPVWPTSGNGRKRSPSAPACTTRWSSNHEERHSPLAALDRVLAGLAVRLHWSGDGVVVVASDHGVAGALARIGLAAHEALVSEVWWRLKICAFDECSWAYYDHSKNRSRHYCEYGCGNKLKTRAYRARRRAATAADGH